MAISGSNGSSHTDQPLEKISVPMTEFDRAAVRKYYRTFVVITLAAGAVPFIGYAVLGWFNNATQAVVWTFTALITFTVLVTLYVLQRRMERLLSADVKTIIVGRITGMEREEQEDYLDLYIVIGNTERISVPARAYSKLSTGEVVSVEFMGKPTRPLRLKIIRKDRER